jgi:hypothetical protein
LYKKNKNVRNRRFRGKETGYLVWLYHAWVNPLLRTLVLPYTCRTSTRRLHSSSSHLAQSLRQSLCVSFSSHNFCAVWCCLLSCCVVCCVFVSSLKCENVGGGVVVICIVGSHTYNKNMLYPTSIRPVYKIFNAGFPSFSSSVNIFYY